MTLVPLDIPAGFYRNGTDLEQSGRWRDGSLVRWRDNSLRPIGGWQVRFALFTASPVRGMHTWESNSGTAYAAGGSYNELLAVTGNGTTFNITPTDLTVGRSDAEVETGYGYGFYGEGFYGQPIQQNSNAVPQEATTWSVDNFGQNLVACSNADGRLLEWDLSTTTELLSDPDFLLSNGSWTLGSQWLISDGFAFAYGSPPYGNLSQSVTGLVVGKTYVVDVITRSVDETETNWKLKATTSSDLVNQTIVNGRNRHSFVADATSATIKIESQNTGTDPITIYFVHLYENDALAAPIANAPTNNLGLLVTEERFIFALGAGGNPRTVSWCDQENNTLWTPASTNQAGSQILQTSGQIMQAIRTKGQTLIITDTDCFSAVYTGPPFIYSFTRAGTSCGAISRKSAVDTDLGVFYMGQRGFFYFDGNSVRELPCDVHDYVFGDFNQSQQSKVWGFTNGQFGEVWWFYCSENSTEIDRYVAYDYTERHWLIGNMARTSGTERGVFSKPLLARLSLGNSTILEHEVGLNVEGGAVFAESGPFSIGNGDQTAHVTKLIPDEETQGDVSVIFKTRFYPNGDESSHGPYTPNNPTSVRFAGRQMRMRVEGAKLAPWRVGNMRVDVKPAGRR